MKSPCQDPCPKAFRYCKPLIGKDYKTSKIMFILNRPTEAIAQTNLLNEIEGISDYEAVLWKHKTGIILEKLIIYSNLTKNDILITNTFQCTLKDDVHPKITKDPHIEDYFKCFHRQLEKQIQEHQPNKIVIFGAKPKKVFKDLIKNNKYNQTPTHFSPHPSWIWAKRSEKRIYEALEPTIDFLQTDFKI